MNAPPEAYEFEEFRVDPLRRLLTRGSGEVVAIAPKAFDTLLHLIQNPGQLLEKDDLMQAVWPDIAVEENNLNQSISALRRALGERAGDHRFIVTVPGHGYKFVAPVREITAGEVDETDPGDEEVHGGDLLSEEVLPAASASMSPANSYRMAAANPADPATHGTRLWLAGLAFASILAVLGFLLLRDRSSEAQTTSIKTMAVLPFKPLVEGNRNEALELGMAETLIGKLSGGEELIVRPLESVRRLSSDEKDALTIGRELQVEAVLEGSIQTAGDRIRISARLYRTADGKQLWAGQFDEKLTDIFDVQTSISERVAAALQTTIKGTGKKRQTDSVEAYQLYIKGRLHASRLTRDEIEKAIDSYNQAIALDPNYALAFVWLSRAYRNSSLTSDAPSNETMPKAKAAALRAIELDETEPEAHAALGLIAFLFDWDWAQSERHYLRALELDPNNASAHAGYAHLLSNTGRHDRAIAEARRARELNPIALGGLAIEAQFLHYAGRSDQALESLNRTIELDPNFWLSHLVLSRVYEQKGMHAEAIASAQKARELSKVNSEATACAAYSMAKSGDPDGAKRILADLTKLSSERYVPPYNLALIHNALGDKEQALTNLEKAFVEKDVRMVFLMIEPKWNNLRNEPRFADLIKRMNFPI